MNKLETSLSQNDLNCLFSTKVEKASNNYFYIITNTHKIYIKNPKITWEKPYTEPTGATIEYVDTTETIIAPTSTTRTELFFNGVASIENYPDLALFDSVILDSPIIEPIELLKNKQFSYNLDYHLYDFGTGQDIDLYDDEKSLSQKEWNAMFEQGVPTINTKNPIVFTADIEAVPLPVNKTIEFVIPGTERKLVIDVDSTRKNCLVDIFVSSLDETVEDALIHIDNFDNKDQLLTAVYLEDDDPVDIFPATIHPSRTTNSPKHTSFTNIVEMNATVLTTEFTSIKGISMPKIKVLSAEKAFEAAHYGGPFDFNKENYIIISITDIRNEEDCPVIFRPIKNLKAVFRVPFIDLAADKLDPNISVKEQTGLDLPVFSEKEAHKIKQIGDFAKEHNYHILVHCEAGVSRSQAVGACLELYVNNDASNIERRIHSGNYTYFQTFFQQFDGEWKILSNLQEPIYQEANDNENLFGFRYKMNDYEEHQLRRGAFGPEYPRSRMLGLTDRINLARLTN